MVIENFRDGNPVRVGERFRARGRLFPADSSITYVMSWMSTDGTRCYQLMESPTREALDPWMAQWDDLVAFEVHPVQTSADFWSRPNS